MNKENDVKGIQGSDPVTVGTLEKPIAIYKEQFGTLLPQISDPPKKLYVAGNLDLLSPESKLTYICIIGSRKYTEYGKTICESLIKSLKGLPVVVVSGLALGIDSIAHRAALENGIPTIAVPGSGLHPQVLYPRSHYSLAEEIIEKGGLMLSEYDPMTSASPWSFPVRNRIMSGLSNAVLIIEAEEDSGTLITARLALDYNRDVLVVPGSIFSSTSKGPHSLIKKGAQVITCEEDLLAYLGCTPEEKTASELSNLFNLCSSDEQKVLKILHEPLSRNDISTKVNLPISQIQIVISMLEIRRLIKEEYGKIYLLHPLPKEAK